MKDDISNKLIKLFLNNPKLSLYRKHFPIIEKLALKLEQSYDRKYINEIMSEIEKYKTDFQKKIFFNIFHILKEIFSDRNLTEKQWCRIAVECYDGFEFSFIRSLLSLKLYLESLSEPVQLSKLQEKYIQNFKYGATDKEISYFNQVNGDFLLKGIIPQFGAEEK